MTDLPAYSSPKPIGRSWRTGITVATLILFAVTIGCLLVWGDDENSLHTSGLAWSYALTAALLAGLGIASIAPDVVKNLTTGK